MTYQTVEPLELLTNHPDGAVEQWIGHRDFDGFRSIQWIRIAREGADFAVYEKDVLDGGIDGMIDLDEFLEIGDPDLPEGVRTSFGSPLEALQFAASAGAKADAFVVRGGLQEVYSAFVDAVGKPRFGIREWIVEGG